jgi:hypothetical protein
MTSDAVKSDNGIVLYSTTLLYYRQPMKIKVSLYSDALATHRQSLRSTSEHSYSTPYISRLGVDNVDTSHPTASFLSQQAVTHSMTDSDSGIVMKNSSLTIDQNRTIEKTLTDLVEKLRRQLENDAQKLHANLEFKLAGLERMINQQTFIIQRQDDIIEDLKKKLGHIEDERDRIRTQLFTCEENPPTIVVHAQQYNG